MGGLCSYLCFTSTSVHIRARIIIALSSHQNRDQHAHTTTFASFKFTLASPSTYHVSLPQLHQHVNRTTCTSHSCNQQGNGRGVCGIWEWGRCGSSFGLSQKEHRLQIRGSLQMSQRGDGACVKSPRASGWWWFGMFLLSPFPSPCLFILHRSPLRVLVKSPMK